MICVCNMLNYNYLSMNIGGGKNVGFIVPQLPSSNAPPGYLCFDCIFFTLCESC